MAASLTVAQEQPATTPLTGVELARIVQNGSSARTTVDDIVNVGRVAVSVDAHPFNATGDGVTDDSAAFVAALAAGGTVMCNATKTYLIGDITIGTNKVIDGQFCRFVRKAGASRVFNLTGFQPGLRNFDILGTLGTDSWTTTTASVGASAGASAITVASVTGLLAGMRIVVQSDFAGGVETHEIASIAGNIITLRNTLRGNIAIGDRVLADFALVEMSGSALVRPRVTSGVIRACLFGIEIGDQGAAGRNSFALIDGVQVVNYTGAGFVFSGNTAGTITTNWAAVGGSTSSASYTGNGATTVYAYTWRFSSKCHRGYNQCSVRVSIDGSALSAPSQYTVDDVAGTVTLAVAPANGAVVLVTNYESACYGIVADRIPGGAPSSIEEISSGIAITQINAIWLDTAELGFFYDVRTDTSTYAGFHIIECSKVSVRECDFLYAAFPVIFSADNATSNVSFNATVRPDASELVVTPNKRVLTVGAGNTNITVNTWNGVKSTNIDPTAGLSFAYGDVIRGRSVGTVAAGSAVYLYEAGTTTTENDAIFRAQSRGYLVGLYCYSTVAPGAGQTFTYTVRLNGADTALLTTTTGAGVFEGVAFVGDPITLNRGASISIRLNTSAGAGVARHQIALVWMPL